MNKRQLQMIEYLREENRVLREQLGHQRLRLTDNQRRRLAAKARRLGRKVLGEVATIVTPETLLRWHRQLVAQKCDGSGKRSPGRPRTAVEIEDLLVRLAQENRDGDTGGFRVHYQILDMNWPGARSLDILERQGIEPAPEAQSEDYVAGVSDATLGSDRGGRLLHD